MMMMMMMLMTITMAWTEHVFLHMQMNFFLSLVIIQLLNDPNLCQFLDLFNILEQSNSSLFDFEHSNTHFNSNAVTWTTILVKSARNLLKIYFASFWSIGAVFDTPPHVLHLFRKRCTSFSKKMYIFFFVFFFILTPPNTRGGLGTPLLDAVKKLIYI